MKLGGNEYAEQLVSLCVEYLTDTHAVLWGQYWDVSDDDQKLDAATWLAEQIDNVAALTLNKTTVGPTTILRPGAIGGAVTNGRKRKPLCLVVRSPNSKIECQQAYGHKGDHAGQSPSGRWYSWKRGDRNGSG